MGAFTLDLTQLRPLTKWQSLHLPLGGTNARGKLPSTKSWSASHRSCPNTRRFPPDGMREEATARWGRVSTLTMLLQKYRASSVYYQVRAPQIRQAENGSHGKIIPCGALWALAHTSVLLSRPSNADCTALWLEMAHKQAFHGTNVRFKATCYFILACLSSRPCIQFWKTGRWRPELGRKDAVDHCDGNFEVTALLWLLLEYSKMKVSRGISNWRQCGRDLTKERNIFFVFRCQTAGSGMYCVRAKCFLTCSCLGGERSFPVEN